MKIKNYAAILALVLVISCKQKNLPIGETEEVAVKIEKIVSENYAQPIISGGIITSDKEARLSFKVSGIIERLYVEEGDAVTKGQLLGTLNQTEISAQLQQAKNDYEKAQRNYNRIASLHKDNAATAEELENSGTGLNTARQSFDIARFNKQYSAIYANQSGNVIKKEMNEGEIADAGVTVYTINSSNSNDWVIKIGLSDKDWVKLKRGDTASITTDAYGDEKFSATVSEIGVGTDAQTGTFLVKLKIKPGNRKFANGLTAKVTIFPSVRKRLLFIPASAIVEANDNTAIVYSLNRDKKSVTQHKIQIAFTENNRVAVASGLENTDNIVTAGASYLTPRSKIKL